MGDLARCSKVFPYLVLILLSHISHAQDSKSPLVLDIIRPSSHSLTSHLPLKGSRDDGIQLDLDIKAYHFLVNFTVGTPPQPLTFTINCNTAEILVTSSTAINAPPANISGLFISDQSSTFQTLDMTLNTSIGLEAIEVHGDFFLDTMKMGNAELEHVKMGLVKNISTFSFPPTNGTSANTLGLGYIGNDSASKTYPDLLSILKTSKRIDCLAYSLYVDDADSSKGQLIVGGIDTAKFQGTLDIIPISTQDARYQSVTIPLKRFGRTNGPVWLTDPLEVRLETAVDFLFLPADVLGPVFANLGFQPPAKYPSLATKPCSQIDNSTTFEFTFGSTTFTGWLSDFIKYWDYINGTDQCYLLMSPRLEGPYAIGLAFLKQMYTVIDLSQNEVSVAMINPNSSESNITLIPALGVAGFSGVPVPTNSPNASTTSLSDGLSIGTKLGIGLGTSLGVIICLCVIGGYLVWQRKKQIRSISPTRTSFNSPQAIWQTLWKKLGSDRRDESTYRELDTRKSSPLQELPGTIPYYEVVSPQSAVEFSTSRHYEMGSPQSETESSTSPHYEVVSPLSPVASSSLDFQLRLNGDLGRIA